MPNRARNSISIPAIALTCVMAVLLCLAQTASAVAAKSPEKTASGNFFGESNIYTAEILPESLQPQWEIAPITTQTASGRQVWLSADPIGEKGGLNLYAYCYGNPLNFYDPDGRHPILIIPIVIGLFATTENAHAPANAEDQNVGPPGIALAAQAVFPPGAGCAKNGIRGLSVARSVPKALTAPAGVFERTHGLSGNASSRTIQSITESMKASGWNGGAISVFENNGSKYILDGHHRVQAAMRANVPVHYNNIPSSLLREFGFKSGDDVVRAACEAGPVKILGK